MNIRIGKGGRYQSGGVVVAERIDSCIIGSDKSIVTDFLITGHTVSNTQFEVIHRRVVFRKPFFLRNTPCQRNGRECSPTVVLTEAGGTVTAHSGCKQVFIFVRIVETCHQRKQCPVALAATDTVHLLAVVHFMDIIKHEDILLSIQVIIVVPLGGRTCHHTYTMFLGESMVEYKIIIPQVGK